MPNIRKSQMDKNTPGTTPGDGPRPMRNISLFSIVNYELYVKPVLTGRRKRRRRQVRKHFKEHESGVASTARSPSYQTTSANQPSTSSSLPAANNPVPQESKRFVKNLYSPVFAPPRRTGPPNIILSKLLNGPSQLGVFQSPNPYEEAIREIQQEIISGKPINHPKPIPDSPASPDPSPIRDTPASPNSLLIPDTPASPDPLLIPDTPASPDPSPIRDTPASPNSLLIPDTPASPDPSPIRDTPASPDVLLIPDTPASPDPSPRISPFKSP